MARQESITECMHHTAGRLRGERSGVIRTMQMLESEMASRCQAYEGSARACWRAQMTYYKSVSTARQDQRMNNMKIERQLNAMERLDNKSRYDLKTSQTGSLPDAPGL